MGVSHQECCGIKAGLLCIVSKLLQALFLDSTTLNIYSVESRQVCCTWCGYCFRYRDCFESNLNGLYHKDNRGPYVTRTNWGNGMVWKHIKGTNFYSLKSSIMKIIPVDLET
jgi:hypothetical protein